jgi:hypothetical protein
VAVDLRSVNVGEPPVNWVAKLTPAPGTDVDALIALPLGLDVWERREHELVVAADERRLAEIERRRLATIERLYTVDEFINRRPQTDSTRNKE